MRVRESRSREGHKKNNHWSFIKSGGTVILCFTSDFVLFLFNQFLLMGVHIVQDDLFVSLSLKVICLRCVFIFIDVCTCLYIKQSPRTGIMQ